MITLVKSKGLNTSQADFKFKGEAVADVGGLMLSPLEMATLKRNVQL